MVFSETRFLSMEHMLGSTNEKPVGEGTLWKDEDLKAGNTSRANLGNDLPTSTKPLIYLLTSAYVRTAVKGCCESHRPEGIRAES